MKTGKFKAHRKEFMRKDNKTNFNQKEIKLI